MPALVPIDLNIHRRENLRSHTSGVVEQSFFRLNAKTEVIMHRETFYLW
jgi:hypothetical protein